MLHASGDDCWLKGFGWAGLGVILILPEEGDYSHHMLPPLAADKHLNKILSIVYGGQGFAVKEWKMPKYRCCPQIVRQPAQDSSFLLRNIQLIFSLKYSLKHLFKKIFLVQQGLVLSPRRKWGFFGNGKKILGITKATRM